MDFDIEQRRRQDEQAQLPPVYFTIRGEQFQVRRNVPFQVLYDVATLTEDTSGLRVIRVAVENIKLMIENTVSTEEIDGSDQPIAAWERWERVCNPDAEFPLTFQDITDIGNWLTGQAVNRPTEASSPLQPGPSATGNGSTELSAGAPAAA